MIIQFPFQQIIYIACNMKNEQMHRCIFIIRVGKQEYIKLNINFKMTSWYGKTSSKQLDALIERKPKLSQLFLYPDFITELKAYNTKLLDYLTNNTSLMAQLVEFMTVAPSQTDSDERKYKLPLVSIQVIETQTTCIHNALFKQAQNGQTYFEQLFRLLDQPEILPLLAGYLFRANICLLNNRQKQTIDKIYSMPNVFSKLIEHSYYMPIANIIQLYLNLDLNKHPTGTDSQARLKAKLQVLQQMMSKIQIESGLRNEKSTMIIENLCGIICQIIQKYYLIINGKQMMDIITSEKTIAMFMAMIRSPFISENAFPAFNFFINLINYYSFSSFNVDDFSNDDGKKSLERLESQPMIVELTNYFPNALERIMRSSVLNLYLYRLLEVLCHCISISSLKIFECTRKTQFFNNLVKLMFQHQRTNILHVLVEKSFLHIFISDRKIYQQYKKHLFCQIDIIDSTAGFFVRQFPLQKLFEQGKKKAYFGHFMRILKIYSGIQTEDQSIIQAIKSKSDLWNKISKHLIIPYQNIYEKKLGTYEQVPEPVTQQFKIDKNLKIKPNPMKMSTIQQINKEEHVPTMPAKGQIQTDLYSKMQEMEQKKAEQMFYRTPIQGFLSSNQILQNGSNLSTNSNSSTTFTANGVASTIKSQQAHQPLPVRPSNFMSQSNVVDYQTTSDKELKKSESFKQFMKNKKVEAEQELKLKRSLSQEKRLSGQKTKLTSPSPQKKTNSWKQQTQQTKPAPPAPVIPKIPLSNRKPLAQSSISERTHNIMPSSIQNNISSHPISPHNTSMMSNLSSMNNSSMVRDETLDEIKLNQSLNAPIDIKKIRIFQIEKPAEKKYRKVDEKDKVLLDFLGISV